MSHHKKREKNKRVGEKIEVLRHEGKSEKAAVGEAEGMERSGRLKRHGKYQHKRNSRRKSGRS
jgi:hypothetical protein